MVELLSLLKPSRASVALVLALALRSQEGVASLYFTAVNGVLAIVLPHISAMRPPVFFMSTKPT